MEVSFHIYFNVEKKEEMYYETYEMAIKSRSNASFHFFAILNVL